MINKPKPILRPNRRVRRPVAAASRPARQSQSTERKPSGKPLLENLVQPPDKSHRIKFAAPIKIIVIHPKSAYYKQVLNAVGIGLSNISIGGVNLTILIYSLHTGDLHAIVFCLAYHFFTVQAILSLNYANGWSTPLRMRHRKLAHIFLNLCGIGSAIAGSILIINRRRVIFKQPHEIIGQITGFLVILCASLGIFAYMKRKPCPAMVHIAFGTLTFAMSSVCLCLGLFYKSFIDWAGITVVSILVSLNIFYTVFIVTCSIVKCISRI